MAKRKTSHLPVAKNQRLRLTIQDLSYQGMGVGKVEGYPIFIANTLPGEDVCIHILKTKKNYAYGKLVERYTDSPDRQPLINENGLRTGTLPLQHMTYEAQLAFKQDQVQRTYAKHPQLRGIQVLPTFGMAPLEPYRNKAQIPVGEKDGQLITGFYRQGSHDIIPVEDFVIQLSGMDEAILAVRNILNAMGVPAYQERLHRGLIRHIIVRKGYYTGEVMVILVINGHELPGEDQIVERITQAVPGLVSLVLNQNTRDTNVILGPDNRILWGLPYYRDQILGQTYHISPQSFFQVNTRQAEHLYTLALEMADLGEADVVLDAYCGIGTITLNIAKKARQVYGVEVVPEAIDMARVNARLNGIDGVDFVAGKAEEVIYDWIQAGIRPNVVFVDPPRKGLAEDFIQAVIQLAPEKIVYISCNPASQARDMALFFQAGYQANTAQPVDMFPGSHHVECVVSLTRV